MTLTTYDDLRQALVDWPDLQGETDLNAYADTLITLAESRINISLRLRRSIASLDVTGSAIESYALPDDFLEADRVIGPDGKPLDYRSADQVDWYEDDDCVNTWTLDAGLIKFAGPVDSFVLQYYAKLPPLQSTSTNWLFNLAPGLYLYSALIDAAIFSKESEQETARYTQMFNTISASLVELDNTSIFPRTQSLQTMRA